MGYDMVGNLVMEMDPIKYKGEGRPLRKIALRLEYPEHSQGKIIFSLLQMKRISEVLAVIH